MHVLAKDEPVIFPATCKAIIHDFYNFLLLTDVNERITNTCSECMILT